MKGGYYVNLHNRNLNLMKRTMVFISFLTFYLSSYSELILKIHEPIRFENINTKAIGDVIVGQGSIQIISDNLEVDKNKKFIFKFPKKGLITNKKRWLTIDKYIMEDNDKNFKVTQEKKIVKIYAYINRHKLNDKIIKAEDLEGEYIGYVPIIVEQYGLPFKKTKSIK